MTEIRLQQTYLQGPVVDTIYFGGGTPSLLSASEIQTISDEINRYFSVVSNAEITLEANPDDLNSLKIREFLSAGINRFSMGVQSFFDEDLLFLNRLHDSATAIRAINDVQDAGISNISIDLIFGIPGMSLQKWEQNLELFFTFNLPHLSAYALTVEPKTTLDLLIRKNKMPAPDEEDAVEQFRLLIKKMRGADYEHYEISNFSKEGMISRHNSNYWKGVHYLGLGPSAHSYNGRSRRWNVSNLESWFSNIKAGKTCYEEEILTPVQQHNEYVMTSLRTLKGCDTGQLTAIWGEAAARAFTGRAEKYVLSGEMVVSGGIYVLTDQGKLFTDGISADLFAGLDEA